MYSDSDKLNMQAFIKRLMLNPCFANETPLSIEEDIILFYLQNIQALKSTFTSPSFFPTLDWRSIEGLFLQSLSDEIDREVIKLLEKILFQKINFSFMNKLLSRQIDLMNYKNQMLGFLQEVLTRFEVRRGIEPALKMINYSIIDRYMREVFSKRSYIAREVERVEKLKLEHESIADYIKVLMLIGAIGYIRTDLDSAPLQYKMQAGEVKYSNAAGQETHFKNLKKQYSTVLSYFPPDLIDKSFQIYGSFADDNFLPATSRIAKIFYHFGRNYKPNIKIDKGADTFGKSWFNIQRRNYKFYGFDNNILDEFYRISAENYW